MIYPSAIKEAAARKSVKHCSMSEETAARIRKLRAEEGLTVAQLAERFGCGKSSISRALAQTKAEGI